MITISVKSDIAAAVRRLTEVQRKQIPFAASVAINNTAEDAKGAMRRHLAGAIDRPKPYTLGGLFVARSNKRKLQATVGLIDKPRRGGRAPVQYLEALLRGAPRRMTGYERALQRARLLPAGARAVPGSAAKLDRYGNLNRKQLREVFGALRAGVGVAAGRGKRARLEAYFVADGRGHLPAGLWRRIARAGQGSTVAPYLLFVSGTNYRRRLDMVAAAAPVIRRNFSRHFNAALARALATAR